MPRPDGMSTSDYLAQELEASGLASMIERARQGYYDDFKSPLETPLLTLLADLHAAGQEAFAARVLAGEFDSTLAESQAWYDSIKHTLPPQVRALFEGLD